MHGISYLDLDYSSKVSLAYIHQHDMLYAYVGAIIDAGGQDSRSMDAAQKRLGCAHQP